MNLGSVMENDSGWLTVEQLRITVVHLQDLVGSWASLSFVLDASTEDEFLETQRNSWLKGKITGAVKINAIESFR